MLSDESSSDSETGRFKCRSDKQDQRNKSSSKNENSLRSTGRDRNSEHSRYHREMGRDRKREEKERFDRESRERHRYSRHSPLRRRRSNDRSSNRKRSRERNKITSAERSRSKNARSHSRDRQRQSRSRVRKSADRKNNESQHHTSKVEKVTPSGKDPRPNKFDRSHDKQSLSPEIKVKRSEVYKPPIRTKNKQSENAMVVMEDKNSDSNDSKKIEPGSYYDMKPTVIKEKLENSSEIDSSDDEKLRAKLLKLEKEVHQAKKKKHKKKHRKKDKSNKDEKDIEAPISVEVSSTTDIQDKVNTKASVIHIDSTEVTSTQKNSQVESNEEGEIISDEDSQADLNIDPNDLRHKLKRSVPKSDCIELKDVRAKIRSKSDVCGPALPPHLENDEGKDSMVDTEGPALPPHLRKMDRKIGPSIPDQLRRKLEQGDCEIIKCESSDEEGIGPVPAGAEASWTDAHRRLEERALHAKIRSLEGHSLHSSKVKSREQWMLELPEGKAKYLGLEARSFRAKEGPDMSDRSGWTDTPEQKARKDAGLEKEDLDTVLQREARARQLAMRDEHHERAVKKHKKKHKREESLLEMHEKKLKKKKKKADKDKDKGERRPFSRDVDLQVHRFDEAQKRSVIKKAQQLDSRFSRGEAKYL